MTRAEPQACVNIKYNHTDSKTTDLTSLSRCHEYIFNESSIPSFEIRVNLCEPMTSVSSLNSITLSLIYLRPLLKFLKYIYLYIMLFSLNILFSIIRQLMEFLSSDIYDFIFKFYSPNLSSIFPPHF